MGSARQPECSEKIFTGRNREDVDDYSGAVAFAKRVRLEVAQDDRTLAVLDQFFPLGRKIPQHGLIFAIPGQPDILAISAPKPH